MPALSISRILMPVDFSPRAEVAVRYAGRLARHFKAQLHLLHVIEPPQIDFAMAELPASLDRVASVQRERAQPRLEQFAAPDLSGIELLHTVAQGHPADEILAQAQQVDLVVMPTQGHGRIREFLIGSVTAKVLHDCERPVLTGVHLTGNGEVPEWHVNSVLCAIDFGPESENVLKWGAVLAGKFGAAVNVVHANADPNAGYHLEQSVKAAGLHATPVVEAGEPHRVVVATAQKLGADLLIIGRGSNTGTLGRLRAQAYEIVRKSPCPVLSV